ncbi:carboxypeptidase regulatory-like domain-containing protein [Pseudoduganella sp. UC29_71]|jgi:hypothetical protein|uniref:carboxypeptidase regulatory-like domain-containing protein n=1 Tax=Pseudoduganella sp. UC29_71 TaxID=3350174 RepID=UPI00366C5D81
MKSTMYRNAARVMLAGALALGGAWANAQEPEYISGGVGSEQREDMQAQRGHYNLLLTFADRDGELRAGVALTVRDRKGNTVLELPDAGPMVYAKLPPGSYRITASTGGREQVRTATVGNSPRELYFHWAPETLASQ